MCADGAFWTCVDATFRQKKLKPTQRLLAEIDLEMEEQFLLKQKHLKELADDPDLKEPQSLGGGVNGGFDLNQELVDEDETKPEGTAQTVTRTIDFVSQFIEPAVTSNKASGSEAAMEKKPFEAKLRSATFLSRPLEGDFGEESSGVKKLVDATGCSVPPELSLKLRPDDSNLNHDSGFDEGEKLEFLLSRSPRASRTYKWGGTIGSRRRLHNDCNVLVEAAAPPGSGVVRDSKDHELPSKGNSEWK